MLSAAAPTVEAEPAAPPVPVAAEPARSKAAAPAARRSSPARATPAVAASRDPGTPQVAEPDAASAAEQPAPLLALATTRQAEPAASQPAASTGAGDETIPHYRTRMPGTATLRYAVRRGVLQASGELQWRPQGDQYEIKLESKLGGLTLLTQISSGGFDADGIAPARFTDTRIRRSTVAANFQREAGKDGGGKITFSGSSDELPLMPGVQDRVSWMVQLAAIVAAQPNLRVPGAKVVMHVVGAHADASVWAFKCTGVETVDTELGPIAALKFVREPRDGSYDTTAQAWLDPKHHFLPARATLRSGPNDEGYELHLQDVIGTP
jgi:hypothetical protein